MCAELGPQDRRTGDQGGRRSPIPATCATSNASTSTSTCSTPPQRRRSAPSLRGGTGESFDWGLLAARRSRTPADPLRRPARRQRRRGDRASPRPWAVDVASGTESVARAQGPRADAGVLRRRGGAPTSRPAEAGAAGVSATREQPRRRAPLRPLRGPVRSGDADAGARGARAGVAARRAPTRATAASSTGLLRDFAGRPDAAVPRQPPVRARRPQRLPQARGPQPHRLAQAQQRPRPGAAGPADGQARIIAETGAGQHGVATATVCALLGMECVVYMGVEDTVRQRPNVQRMQLLGASVEPVEAGSSTLKEATSAAIRDWVANVESTHYVIGSVVGPGALPGDRARPAAGDRRRGPGAAARARGAAAGARGRVRGRGLERDRHLRRLHRRASRSSSSAWRRAGEGIDTPRHGAPLTVGGRPGRAARLALGGDAGRGGPDPAGPLDLGGARLPRRRAPARPPARQRPGALRGRDRRRRRWPPSARWRGSRASSPRSRPPTRWPGCSPRSDGELDLVCLSGRGDKDLAEVLGEGPA